MHERTDEVVVVDLKTGKYKPSGPEVASHPQLGLYQLAVRHGALDDEPRAAGRPPGAAELVHLRLGTRLPEVQEKPPPDPDSPVDVDWFTTREREQNEVLPWDHLDSGLDKDWLWEDWQDALAEVDVEDCRWTPCYDCGVCDQMGTEIQVGPSGTTLLGMPSLGRGERVARLDPHMPARLRPKLAHRQREPGKRVHRRSGHVG